MGRLVGLLCPNSDASSRTFSVLGMALISGDSPRGCGYVVNVEEFVNSTGPGRFLRVAASSNPSMERTLSSRLRRLESAAHGKR